MDDLARMTSTPARPRLGFLIQFAAFIVVIAGIKAASDLVLLILVSVFVAVAIAPPIFALEKRGVPFVAGLILVVGALLGIVGGAAGLVGSSVQDFRRQLPFYEQRVRDAVPTMTDLLRPLGIEITDFTAGIRDLADPGRS